MKAKLLGDHFCDSNSVNSELELNMEEIEAKKLLVYNRLDLIPKIRFVEDVLAGEFRKFTKSDYKISLDAFSDGKFTEPGQANKNSFEFYVESFLNLIKNIKEHGFDPEKSVIPVGENNIILDGSHRLSIAIVLEIHVQIVRLENLSKIYSTTFFLNSGVSSTTVESWVSDYLSRTSNHATFILWPKLSTKHRDLALKIIEKSVDGIIYKRTDNYSKKSLHLITAVIYYGHPWTGSYIDRFNGCKAKARQISSGQNNSLTSITVQVNEDLVEGIKKTIRDSLNVGNAGIHSSDNLDESKYISSHFYNYHTRNIFKRAKSLRYPLFLKNLFLFRDRVTDNNLCLDDFIIVSSSVLGLYGLRKPNDIDFLSSDSNFNLVENRVIENHHHVLAAYNSSKRDYLTESRNFIVFFGVKIYSIEEMIKSNKNRKENTKFTDIKLAELRSHQYSFYIYWLRFIGWFQRLVRSTRQNFMKILFKIGHKLPTLKIIYKRFFNR